ncbi:MAG TPA: hypothetical protein VH916_13560, partial [Dehalococcoidia bacterium]
DLVHWTEPQKILDGGSWYGEVLGLGPGESDSLAGQTMLVLNGGVVYGRLTFESNAEDPRPF